MITITITIKNFNVNKRLKLITFKFCLKNLKLLRIGSESSDYIKNTCTCEQEDI